MSVNAEVFGLIAMAVAVVAILAVGTLVAADVIHVGSRSGAGVAETDGSNPHLDERSDPAAALVARVDDPGARSLKA